MPFLSNLSHLTSNQRAQFEIYVHCPHQPYLSTKTSSRVNFFEKAGRKYLKINIRNTNMGL